MANRVVNLTLRQVAVDAKIDHVARNRKPHGGLHLACGALDPILQVRVVLESEAVEPVLHVTIRVALSGDFANPSAEALGHCRWGLMEIRFAGGSQDFTEYTLSDRFIGRC